MNKKQISMEQLSQEELAEVNGGIRYEKPILFLLDGEMGVCNNGNIKTGSCSTGYGCKQSSFDTAPMTE